MKDTEILKIDARGRIVIPRSMRRTLGLKENSFIMIVSEAENNELRIIPLPFTDDQAFLRIRIVIPDKVGALSRISGVFAKQNISIIYGQTIVLKKGTEAEWSVISPPITSMSLDDFKNLLINEGGALRVQIETPVVNKE